MVAEITEVAVMTEGNDSPGVAGRPGQSVQEER